jgi:hypothetical protein
VFYPRISHRIASSEPKYKSGVSSELQRGAGVEAVNIQTAVLLVWEPFVYTTRPPLLLRDVKLLGVWRVGRFGLLRVF